MVENRRVVVFILPILQESNWFVPSYLEQAKPGLPKQVSQEPLWAILSMLHPMESEVRMNAEFDRWICNGSIVSMRQF